MARFVNPMVKLAPPVVTAPTVVLPVTALPPVLPVIAAVLVMVDVLLTVTVSVLVMVAVLVLIELGPVSVLLKLVVTAAGAPRFKPANAAAPAFCEVVTLLVTFIPPV